MHYCVYDSVLQFITILYPLHIYYHYILAPEVVIPPSSVSVFSGNTAEVTCQTRNAEYVIWTLNGTNLGRQDANNPLHNDVNVHQIGTFPSGINSTLTIRARTEYHGLVIQCVAGVEGGLKAESENATLMVQGTVELSLVGHVANMYTDLIHPLPVQVCWIQ